MSFSLLSQGIKDFSDQLNARDDKCNGLIYAYKENSHTFTAELLHLYKQRFGFNDNWT